MWLERVWNAIPRYRHVGPVSLAIAALALAAAGVFDERLQHRLPPTPDSIALFTLGSKLAQAHAMQRATLLTGVRAARDGYAEAAGQAAALAATLAQPTGRDADLQAAIDQVETEVIALLGFMREEIALYDHGSIDQVRSWIGSGRDSHQSRLSIEVIRAAIIKARAAELDAAGMHWTAVLLIGTAFLLLLAAVVWGQGRHRADQLALALSRHEAELAGRARSRFLASASHDLRQPLHALNLFVGALERRLGRSDTALLLEGVRGATQSMDRMFNALLDISRLEAGELRADISDFNLGELLYELAGEYQAVAAEKGLGFSLTTADLAVHSDPALLERILRNLIGNALRYTGSGQVQVLSRRAGGRVLVEVRDTGPGIDEHRRELIFEEFQRLEPEVPGGLGLGLAIVRRLASLLRIEIGVESTIGVGSVFWLRIPVAEAPPLLLPVEAPPRPAVVAVAHPVPANPAPARGAVLLLEDDPLVREAMQSELADLGVTSIAAGSVESLLERLDAGRCEQMPQLVIIDLDLGDGRSGLRILPALTWRFGATPPALVITGVGGKKVLSDLAQAGVPYLLKPVQTDDLRRTLRDRLAA